MTGIAIFIRHLDHLAAHSAASMRILAISGSLRARSSNTRLIEAACLCAPAGMTVSRYDGLGGLPYFNPDLERDALPASVAIFRGLVGAADALLICSPEYARGVSGVMKNALDWLVGGVECPGKPVAILNASQRAVDADAHLRLIVRTMNAHLVEGASITVPLGGRDQDPGELAGDPGLRTRIAGALEALRRDIVGRTHGA